MELVFEYKLQLKLGNKTANFAKLFQMANKNKVNEPQKVTTEHLVWLHEILNEIYQTFEFSNNAFFIMPEIWLKLKRIACVVW